MGLTPPLICVTAKLIAGGMLVFTRTETVLEPLITAKSGLPSPLKSAIDTGLRTEPKSIVAAIEKLGLEILFSSEATWVSQRYLPFVAVTNVD